MRYKEFTDDWLISNISNEFIFLSNNSLSRDDLNYDCGCRKNIHYGDILTKYTTVKNITDNDVPYINDNIKISGSSVKLISGDIIVADTAEDYTVGKTIEIYNPNSLEIYSGLHTIPLRPKHEFSMGYLAYYFNSYNHKKRTFPLIQGIKVYSISKSVLSSSIIKYPTLDEQEKIAQILIKIDARISTQKKIIEDLKTLIDSISFIANMKNGEFYKVKDLCNIGRGRVISTVEISKQLNPVYPVFSSQTQNNGIMGYLDNYEFDGEYITWTTDGANAGTIFYHNEKFNCTNVCGTLKVIHDNTSAKYLSIILPHYVQKYVSKNLANPKLMNNTMANIEVKIIPISEQLKIINVVSSLENKLNNEKSILKLYIKQKEYLLNKLFI